MIVDQAQILINTGFCYSIQDGISQTHYVVIAFIVRYNFLGFICHSIHMQDLLQWVMTEHGPSRWKRIPFFGGDAHHETA